MLNICKIFVLSIPLWFFYSTLFILRCISHLCLFNTLYVYPVNKYLLFLIVRIILFKNLWFALYIVFVNQHWCKPFICLRSIIFFCDILFIFNLTLVSSFPFHKSWANTIVDELMGLKFEFVYDSDCYVFNINLISLSYSWSTYVLYIDFISQLHRNRWGRKRKWKNKLTPCQHLF